MGDRKHLLSPAVSYRARRCYLGRGDLVNTPVEVSVADGVITAVRFGQASSATLPGYEIVDLGPDSTILPGLIDAHVHLGCTGGPASIAESATQSEDVLEARAVVNAHTMLHAGVTTVRDAGGKGYSVLRVRDQNARPGGLRILASGMPVTVHRGHLYFYGLEADSADEVGAAVERLASAGVDFIKVMASAGIQTDGNDPHRAQYSASVLARLVGTAHRNGLRVAAHAHSVESIENAVSAGVDTIEHFSWLARPGDDRKLADLADRVAERGIVVDPTTSGLDASIRPDGGLSSEQGAVVRAIIARRTWCLRMLADRGVEVIAGTDAGSSQMHFDAMVDSLALLAQVMDWDAAAAIRSATAASARALGLDGAVGAIRPGMRADLLAVAEDVRRDIGVLKHPVLVLKDGLPVRSDLRQAGRDAKGAPAREPSHE